MGRKLRPPLLIMHAKPGASTTAGKVCTQKGKREGICRLKEAYIYTWHRRGRHGPVTSKLRKQAVINVCTRAIPSGWEEWQCSDHQIRNWPKQNAEHWSYEEVYGTKWQWDKEENEAFEASIMAFYDKHPPTEVVTDASPIRLGAILARSSRE